MSSPGRGTRLKRSKRKKVAVGTHERRLSMPRDSVRATKVEPVVEKLAWCDY